MSSDVGESPLGTATAAAVTPGAAAPERPDVIQGRVAPKRTGSVRARQSACRASLDVERGRPPRRREARLGWRGVLAVALLAGGAGAVLSASAHAGGVDFSGRIAAGCDDLAECQSLEAEAERRASECLVFCGRAAAEHRAARLMRYRAEERRAVRDHYRAREQADQLEQERARARALDERQRRDSARAEQAAREQQERLQLEQLRQAHLDRRLEDERQRRVGYYAALGPEGRARRLERCLGQRERCDLLALDLLDAARDDEERRSLAELNERITPPAASAPASPHTPPTSSSGKQDEARAASHTPSAYRHAAAAEVSRREADGLDPAPALDEPAGEAPSRPTVPSS